MKSQRPDMIDKMLSDPARLAVFVDFLREAGCEIAEATPSTILRFYADGRINTVFKTKFAKQFSLAGPDVAPAAVSFVNGGHWKLMLKKKTSDF